VTGRREPVDVRLVVRGDAGAATIALDTPDGPTAPLTLTGLDLPPCHGELEPAALAELGRRLGALLLPPALASAVRGMAGGQPVRLRLDLPDSSLAALPWEAARHEERFLGLDSDWAIVRHQGSMGTPAPLRGSSLRVTVAWANPGSGARPPLPHLRAEVGAIAEVLRRWPGLRMEVDEVPYATPAALEQHLRERPPHILHFVGHGDRRPSGGVLVLHGSTAGAEAVVYGEELARWLGSGETRLVLLSACRTGGENGSVGAELARLGIPAVLGMQHDVRDAHAVRFSEAFYRALAAGDPVDSAALAGRRAASTVGPDWVAPVLYLAPGAEAAFTALRRTSAAVSSPFTVPYRRNPGFTGRTALLETLAAALRDGAQPVALVGIGGAGKTQLAVEHAHEHRRHYPGGIFWISGRDSLRVREDYAALTRFFDLPEAGSLEDRARRVREALQDLPEPSLLVVDGLEEETELSLPACGACRILITSRARHLAREGFLTCEVGPLDPDEARRLAQRLRPAGTQAEETALTTLVERMGRLPLALSLVAHHVHQLQVGFDEYLENLVESGAELDWLEQARRRFVASTGHDGSLFNAIRLSCDRLSPEALELLSTAACFAPRGISLSLLREAAGHRFLTENVADLEDYCLVTRERDKRLSLQGLVRAYAQLRLEPAARLRTLQRVAQVLTDHLRVANDAQDWNAARPEAPHGHAAAELCRQLGAREELGGLATELGHYLSHQREWRPAVELLEEALTLTEELTGPDSPSTIRALVRLSSAEQHLADVAGSTSTAEVALEHARRAAETADHRHPGDDALRGEAYNGLGYVLKFQGRGREALDFYHRALELHQRAHGGDHPEVALCLNNIGAAHEQAGELDRALDHYERALAIDRRTFGERHPRVAVRLNNAGRVLRRQGRSAEALQRHHEALQINEVSYGRGHLHAGWSLAYMGHAAHDLERWSEAAQYHAEALPILERHYGGGAPACRDIRQLLADRPETERN
jgi:tetratricopeptide (TPR) repeat protein